LRRFLPELAAHRWIFAAEKTKLQIPPLRSR
jgi:hypothetical protein